jgi:hypothetical protein
MFVVSVCLTIAITRSLVERILHRRVCTSSSSSYLLLRNSCSRHAITSWGMRKCCQAETDST